MADEAPEWSFLKLETVPTEALVNELMDRHPYGTVIGFISGPNSTITAFRGQPLICRALLQEVDNAIAEFEDAGTEAGG